MNTVPEAADQFGVSQKTVWAWVYTRQIEVVRLGRAVRIPQAAIEQKIAAGTTPAKAR